MSSVPLVATALILASLTPTPGPQDRDPPPGPEEALKCIARFGGRVIPVPADPTEPSCLAPDPPVPPPLKGPWAVKFANTHFTDCDLAAVADSLGQISDLQVLDLSYTRVKGESLGWLAGFPSLRLKELDLSSTPISGDGLRELARLDSLKGIRLNHTTLHLSDMLDLQGMFPGNLRTLHLSGARLLDRESQPLRPDVILNWVRGFTHLEDLALSGTLAAPGSPGASGVGDLTYLGHLTDLTRLDLSDNKLTAPDDPPKHGVIPKLQAVIPLARLEKLTTLRLGGNGDLNDQSLKELWPTVGPVVYRLKKLDLSGTKLTDQGLKLLAHRNPNLVDLNISKTRTMVDQKQVPTALRGLTHLCTLNIAGTGVGNAMFLALGNGRGLACLTSLDISGTMVTNAGLATDRPQIVVPFRGLLVIYAADTKVTAAGTNHRNALAALAGRLGAPMHSIFGAPPQTPATVELKPGRMP
jgi:Leucine-rich repeat (LRR) protein